MLKRAVTVLIVACLFILPGIAFTDPHLNQIDIKNVLRKGIPAWMESQIENDLAFFKYKNISLSEMNEFYKQRGSKLQLAKFIIQNNKVTVEKDFLKDGMNGERIMRFKNALSHLCKTVGLPNTMLFISTQDGLNVKEGMPIFAMCKVDSEQIILIPDYEALGARYQVLKNRDITKETFVWENKLPKLIWRGSTAQLWTWLTEKHLPLLTRVTLCELGQRYPDLIDAKFTIYAQGGESIPYLKQFKGDRCSFEEQLTYKYHILIDGNTCAYSTSGWKHFGNSLLFKPDSRWFQWYYSAMQPYVHYIPVKQDLSDLVDALHWAMDHDKEAKTIAHNCREFALSHITLADDLLYLYHLIVKYSRLNFL